MKDVILSPCNDYSEQEISRALHEILDGLDFPAQVKPGTVIGIKANLVSAMKPESAATTHPALLAELTRILKGLGASVIVGDSPGGLYNKVFLSQIYKATGMAEVQAAGAELNYDFGISHAEYPEGKVLKDFVYTSWLDKCDMIIDFCKLKSHGMMGLSCAAKNLFGVIPGTTKPEYHFRFPNHADFSAMIIDLDNYFKPVISICDAVVGMEGNGPTQGTPRKVGLLIGSLSPHKLDLAAAKIIGLGISDVPTLNDAFQRGYIPESAEKLTFNRDVSEFLIDGYENLPSKSILFEDNGKLFAKITKAALASKPKPKKSACIGCGKCEKICPAHAITIKNKKAAIDRSLCIRCFCCQEFCPVGAMKVHRPIIAKIINK